MDENSWEIVWKHEKFSFGSQILVGLQFTRDIIQMNTHIYTQL